MTSLYKKISGFIFAGVTLFSSQLLMAEELPKVSIKTSMGEIVVELYPDAAPIP
jgi:hypothetical protein